jgi:hypothetical protein
MDEEGAMIIIITLIMIIYMKNNKNEAFALAVATPTPLHAHTPAPESRMRDTLTNLLRVTTEKATTCTLVTVTQWNGKTDM